MEQIRKVRWGVFTKLGLGVGVSVIVLTFSSNAFLLNYFFKDKVRYILYAVHEGSGALCERIKEDLSVGVESKGERIEARLKSIEYASSFIYSAPHKKIVQSYLHERTARNAIDGISTTLTDQIKTSQLDHFTVQHQFSFAADPILISACKLSSEETPRQASEWLVMFVDSSEALQPARNFIFRIAVVFGALGILTLLGVLALARSFTRPLAKLQKAADELGAGNYSYNFNITNLDEFGVLADHFGLLASRLTARESELEKATDLANRDVLTGLPNRRFFQRKSEELFAELSKAGKDLSLIFLDVDHFKKINDTLGHDAGDAVLKEFASILGKHVRPNDFAARLGGEEFVVVLPSTDLAEALKRAEALIQKIRSFGFLGSTRKKVTASLGVASLRSGGYATLETLVKGADDYAYESKRRGRDCISSASTPAI